MSSDLIKTKGIIIKERDEKEYDKLLTILTPSFGKINAWSNGCRKVNSKNVGKARTFVYADFELNTSRFGYTVSHIGVLESFEEILSNEKITFYAFYFLEVVDYITYENMECEDIIKLLYYSLKALINENIDNELARRIFELKVLEYNGTYDNTNIDKSLQYTWDYVFQRGAENVYNFKLSEELLTKFALEVERQFLKNIGKKFNTRRYLT